MTKGGVRCLAGALFLASPLSCASSFAFMGRRTEAIYYGLCALSVICVFAGCAALAAKPVEQRPGWRGVYVFALCALVGARVGAFLPGDEQWIGVLVCSVMSGAAGALLLFYEWLCHALHRAALEAAVDPYADPPAKT